MVEVMKYMKRNIRLGGRAVATLMALATASQAGLSYTGSLSYPDGLYAQGVWADPATKIEWTVTDYSTYWHYEYTLTAAAQNISHMIIEVSPSFQVNDIWNIEPSFIGSDGLDDWTEQQGNPGLPDTFRGLKWNFGTATTLTVEFDSDRAPVWGDFYAKDGKAPHTDTVNLAYNLGFTSPDTDPTAAIGNGSVDNHLLVPDTKTVVPLPGAVLLGFLGLGAAGLKLRNSRDGRQGEPSRG
jgi:hypothetical protein